MTNIIVYFICLTCTMYIVYKGERKTSVDPSRDEKEFDGRMYTAFSAVVIFVMFLIARDILLYFI